MWDRDDISVHNTLQSAAARAGISYVKIPENACAQKKGRVCPVFLFIFYAAAEKLSEIEKTAIRIAACETKEGMLSYRTKNRNRDAAKRRHPCFITLLAFHKPRLWRIVECQRGQGKHFLQGASPRSRACESGISEAFLMLLQPGSAWYFRPDAVIQTVSEAGSAAA